MHNYGKEVEEPENLSPEQSAQRVAVWTVGAERNLAC